MIKPHSSFVDVNDIRLHYLEWDPAKICQDPATANADNSFEQDSDDLPIVLLHGLNATADTWRLLAEQICSQRQLIAFDLRGHGQSDQPEDGYDLVTIAEDIISAMATLGLGQVALVGHGLGARIALVLTARHPALISHLVLVDCPLVEPKHWPGMTRERFIRDKETPDIYASEQHYLQTMQDEMASFWSPDVEAILKTYIRELPNGHVEEGLRTSYQRQMRESLWEDRALSYYSKLTCPVLLVPAADQPHPDEELPERLENADEFAAAKGYMAAQVARTIPRCTVLWMPDTTHEIQLQRPQLLAQAIANFVKE
ncbi:alpha/beta fold hydrolase [Ktedonosporobacter rubrisoli]|nr:alpha/beta hydrolase [Ktedonosporobacter rubrisoli]